MPRIVDANGADITSILTEASETYKIPLLALLTIGIAESNLNPNAFRDGVWPDVSCGPFQQTVLYAPPIGDGSNTPSNIALCRERFADWHVATWRAATLIATCLDAAFGDLIAACSKYNSGSVQPVGNWWWQSGNCATYRRALAAAQEILKTPP